MTTRERSHPFCTGNPLPFAPGLPRRACPPSCPEGEAEVGSHVPENSRLGPNLGLALLWRGASLVWSERGHTRAGGVDRGKPQGPDASALTAARGPGRGAARTASRAAPHLRPGAEGPWRACSPGRGSSCLPRRTEPSSGRLSLERSERGTVRAAPCGPAGQGPSLRPLLRLQAAPAAEARGPRASHGAGGAFFGLPAFFRASGLEAL